jgi:retron-type reverse transcriptase
MTRLELLQKATNKREFAKLLKFNISFLTRTLYVKPIETQYEQFQITKRSGGQRTINAPKPELKDIQSRLSELLLDCIDVINEGKNLEPSLSHGFTRNRSIITNAEKHINQKNVLNIDLSDFFDSFNFGRVRGFFLKNKNFLLHDDIATVIAKIACLNDSLPQGSPCSPVITNLITHSLDVRLASLARRWSCIYSRYADDITFSTRKKLFVPKLVRIEGTNIVVGKRLREEIERSGFEINEKKTRVQLNDSRQDVTGLVVNEKVNIKSEYWRETRAMCHNLFTTGTYTKNTTTGKEEGSISELEGRLNFIDSVDRYNHMRPKGADDHRYQTRDVGLDYKKRLNVREKYFSKFMYYRSFIDSEKPTILCEGKTDNVYLKSAINRLANQYPLLACEKNKDSHYELLVDFYNYSKRTRFLLDLFGGGHYLKKFVQRYDDNLQYYKKKLPKNPVILVLDNDSGPNALIKDLEKRSLLYPKLQNTKEEIRDAEFVHICSNLYLILTPRSNGNSTMMENFFDQPTLSRLVDGRKFDPDKDADSITTYGKNTFSIKVVKEDKSNISFDNFKSILDRIVGVIQYHKKLSDSELDTAQK